MANPVQWFQIQGKNYKALQAFYKKVFGWKGSATPNGDGGMMIAPEAGGIPGGIGPTMDGSACSSSVYISVDNLNAYLKKVVKAGGKPAMPIMDLPGGMGSISGFIDPAGNFTEL